MTSEISADGVFYQERDYAGVGRRVLIDVVDGIIATVVSLIASVAAFAIMPTDEGFAVTMAAVWVIVWFGYFVLLKGSRFRTAGYLLTGARIVNLRGERPSRLSLLVRLLFAVFGPLNLLFDLFWIPSDPHRQALRDKFAHTYVVRQEALPAGNGPIGYSHYTILGGSFLFQEVRIPSVVR